jgi:hypothetical protein
LWRCRIVFFRKVPALSFYSSRERPVIHKRGWKKGKEEREKQKRGKGVPERCCPPSLAGGP